MADSAKKDAGVSQVDKARAQELEQGFRGQEVDPTPNENYTVAGVTSGKPTPETDEKARAEADAARRDAAQVGEPS